MNFQFVPVDPYYAGVVAGLVILYAAVSFIVPVSSRYVPRGWNGTIGVHYVGARQSEHHVYSPGNHEIPSAAAIDRIVLLGAGPGYAPVVHDCFLHDHFIGKIECPYIMQVWGANREVACVFLDDVSVVNQDQNHPWSFAIRIIGSDGEQYFSFRFCVARQVSHH